MYYPKVLSLASQNRSQFHTIKVVIPIYIILSLTRSSFTSWAAAGAAGETLCQLLIAYFLSLGCLLYKCPRAKVNPFTVPGAKESHRSSCAAAGQPSRQLYAFDWQVYTTTPLFLKITSKKRKYSTLAPPIDLNGRPSDITGPESQDRGERLTVEAELAQGESE